MRKLKDLFLISVVLLLVSCSMSAKSDKNETGGVAAQGEVVVLNKADFLTKVYNYEKNQSEWVYEGTKPCIVDFYADWCGPCKKVSPILKELAGEYKNDIIIYKINVDNEKELAAAFGIQSIPTLLFIPAKGNRRSHRARFQRNSSLNRSTDSCWVKSNFQPRGYIIPRGFNHKKRGHLNEMSSFLFGIERIIQRFLLRELLLQERWLLLLQLPLLQQLLLILLSF